MSHVAVRDHFYCIRVTITSIITHLLNFVEIGTDPKFPPFSKIALSHICWVLYWLGTYLITKGNFFNCMFTHFLVLGGQECILTFLDFSLLFQYLFLQIYRHPYYIYYHLFIYLYIAKQKSKKRISLSRLKN